MNRRTFSKLLLSLIPLGFVRSVIASERPLADGTYEATWISGHPDMAFLSACNSLNKSSWRGCPAKTVLWDQWGGNQNADGKWTFTATFIVDSQGHSIKVRFNDEVREVDVHQPIEWGNLIPAGVKLKRVPDRSIATYNSVYVANAY